MTLTSSVAAEPHPPAGRAVAADPTTWPELSQLPASASQQIFRTCLSVLSRPGLIGRLPAAVLPAGVPQVISPLLALTDLMTSIAGLHSGDDHSADVAARQIARVTGARPVEGDRARFALAFGESEEFASLPVGSAWSPEDGATLCRRVDGLSADRHRDHDQLLTLTGPGVDVRAGLAVSGPEPSFFRTRAALTDHFPTGVDLLLVTDDGHIAGLPRTTRIEVA